MGRLVVGAIFGAGCQPLREFDFPALGISGYEADDERGDDDEGQQTEEDLLDARLTSLPPIGSV